MKNIKHIETKNTKTEFDKKVLSAIQHLQSYIKHRLYIAESIGILPKNMYTSNDIIDEGIVKLYEKGFNQDADTMFIKIELFKIADAYLDVLFKKESFHKNTVSTHSILTEELNNLEEKYTTDADLDYVMDEDLDDISYKQDEELKHLFLYNDKNSNIIKLLDLEHVSTLKIGKLLGTLYSWLPIKVSSIVDLYFFGKLSLEEISKIKHIEVSRVKTVLTNVEKRFGKNFI
ncbi:MAG: hypothetical protein KAJ28_05850 [Flavobacteriaceae bacterium]|nr:hypothetical protein [Flavobacteriaceae bacterium]